MNQLRRVAVLLSLLTLLIGGIAGYSVVHPRHIAHAQFGATNVPGFFSGAVSAFPPVTVTGQAGTVTNTGTTIMQVDGGPVFCSGNQSTISESTIGLAPNTTFLIVYNCPQELVYAKKAVVGPGTPSPDQPGVPATILAPVYGIEVPLALVVCGASTCGTITDQRPLASFPAGAVQAGSVTFANLPATYPNGGMIYCSTCTLPAAPATCVGAGTGSVAFRVNGAWVCP